MATRMTRESRAIWMARSSLAYRAGFTKGRRAASRAAPFWSGRWYSASSRLPSRSSRGASWGAAAGLEL